MYTKVIPNNILMLGQTFLRVGQSCRCQSRRKQIEGVSRVGWHWFDGSWVDLLPWYSWVNTSRKFVSHARRLRQGRETGERLVLQRTSTGVCLTSSRRLQLCQSMCQQNNANSHWQESSKMKMENKLDLQSDVNILLSFLISSRYEIV